MRNKATITTVLAVTVFLTGVFITRAQPNVDVQAQQELEVQSDTETDSATASQQAVQADARANSTTSADVEADDAGGEATSSQSHPSRNGLERAAEKSSAEVFAALSIEEDSPLRNPGVRLGIRGNQAATGTAMSESDVSIKVSGEEVRGWSDEQKEAVRSRLEAASENNAANDFGLRVAMAALDNENVVDITTDKDVTEVRYKSEVKLFGFIPTRANATARAEANGEVDVDHPWYSFLASGSDDVAISQLTAELRADHDAMISAETEEES